MVNKIVKIEEAIKAAKSLQAEGKILVLAGGCFDILHIGHITFLEKAKGAGDALFVLLEPDIKIKKLKGSNRPINNQEDRAKILTALSSVDYVILLPSSLTDQDYFDIINKLKPDIIAVTKGDTKKNKKEQQALAAGGKVLVVTNIISDTSTSKLVKLLGEDL